MLPVCAIDLDLTSSRFCSRDGIVRVNAILRISCPKSALFILSETEKDWSFTPTISGRIQHPKPKNHNLTTALSLGDSPDRASSDFSSLVMESAVGRGGSSFE
jgi:hypothetical protein